jgi:hypothetical protein
MADALALCEFVLERVPRWCPFFVASRVWVRIQVYAYVCELRVAWLVRMPARLAKFYQIEALWRLGRILLVTSC